MGPERWVRTATVFSSSPDTYAAIERRLAAGQSIADAIEAVASGDGKSVDGDLEVAAVQDWTTLAMVYLRPGYERAEELLGSLAAALRPD